MRETVASDILISCNAPDTKQSALAPDDICGEDIAPSLHALETFNWQTIWGWVARLSTPLRHDPHKPDATIEAGSANPKIPAGLGDVPCLFSVSKYP